MQNFRAVEADRERGAADGEGQRERIVGGVGLRNAGGSLRAEQRVDESERQGGLDHPEREHLERDMPA